MSGIKVNSEDNLCCAACVTITQRAEGGRSDVGKQVVAAVERCWIPALCSTPNKVLTVYMWKVEGLTSIEK